MSLQSMAYGSSGQQIFLSLFHSEPGDKLFPKGKSPHSNQHPLVFTARRGQTQCRVTPGDSGATSWSTFHSPKPDITAGTWSLIHVSPVAAGYCPDRKAVISTVICTSRVNFLKHRQKCSIWTSSAPDFLWSYHCLSKKLGCLSKQSLHHVFNRSQEVLNGSSDLQCFTQLRIYEIEIEIALEIV